MKPHPFASLHALRYIRVRKRGRPALAWPHARRRRGFIFARALPLCIIMCTSHVLYITGDQQLQLQFISIRNVSSSCKACLVGPLLRDGTVDSNDKTTDCSS